jgi:hypothetical protein
MSHIRREGKQRKWWRGADKELKGESWLSDDPLKVEKFQEKNQEYKKFQNVKKIYCNVLVGPISQWNFITLKVQYTTVNYGQQLF